MIRACSIIVRRQAPADVTDFRDPKLPGFALRARPSGIPSWRVQLPNRKWLTIARVDEVALSDARATAQTRRAQAALGQEIPTRRPTSDITLRTFLDDVPGLCDPWADNSDNRLIRTMSYERRSCAFSSATFLSAAMAACCARRSR